jgi:hypothetical protein
MFRVQRASSEPVTAHITQEEILELRREAERRAARVAAETAAERRARSVAEDNLRTLQ